MCYVKHRMRVGGWGGRLVGLSPCPPFGIYSRVYVIHFGRCPFFVLSQPSHAVSAIKIVEMDLDCGLLLAIKQTLSCVRGLLATYLVRSLFFFFVCGKCPCLPNEATDGCFVLYISCKSVQCSHTFPFLLAATPCFLLNPETPSHFVTCTNL